MLFYKLVICLIFDFSAPEYYQLDELDIVPAEIEQSEDFPPEPEPEKEILNII